jgi:hypothetical protein
MTPTTRILAVLLALLASPAAAQNVFPTPGGQNVEGTQILCQNAAGKSVACGSGSGGGSIPVVTAPLTYTASTSASVGTTSGTLFAAGAYTRVVNVCTLPTSTTNVWLNPLGTAATANSGLLVFAGGGCVPFGTPGVPMPTAAVTAITDGGVAQTVVLAGG